VQISAPAAPTAITAVTTTPPPPQPIVPQPPPVAHVPVRTPAVLDTARNCTHLPEYPIASRRNEESGTTSLRFLVDVDGRPIKGEVVRTSGHKRLDEAALAGLLSACKFKPATVDGKPEQTWQQVDWVWRLTD